MLLYFLEVGVIFLLFLIILNIRNGLVDVEVELNKLLFNVILCNLE